MYSPADIPKAFIFQPGKTDLAIFEVTETYLLVLKSRRFVRAGALKIPMPFLNDRVSNVDGSAILKKGRLCSDKCPFKCSVGLEDLSLLSQAAP